jgi:hypothetical protein
MIHDPALAAKTTAVLLLKDLKEKKIDRIDIGTIRRYLREAFDDGSFPDWVEKLTTRHVISGTFNKK